MVNKNRKYTELYEIDVNEDLKIALKKPNFRFIIKHQKDITNLPTLLQSKKNLEENLDKAFGIVGTVLTHSMVDPETMKPILSEKPDEDQCRFEDFAPNANWELLEVQGIYNRMNGDLGFALFAFLMEKIGALHFGDVAKTKEEQTKSFPEERTGDEVSDNVETLSDKTE